jgi:prepilin-type N-terminal cleavage/methylation domain-containing protein
MGIEPKNKGFTLIELIVVIGILGTLAVGAMVALNPLAQFQKANDARRKSDLAQIQRALESYYQDHNNYPGGNESNGYKIQDWDTARQNFKDGSSPVDWGSAWQPYMNVLPKNPNSSSHYAYYSPDGQSYYLYASLDRVSSSDQCQGAAPCGTTACVSGKCNFGVSSPDVTP